MITHALIPVPDALAPSCAKTLILCGKTTAIRIIRWMRLDGECMVDIATLPSTWRLQKPNKRLGLLSYLHSCPSAWCGGVV